MLYLPSEDELRAELEREQRAISQAAQAKQTTNTPDDQS
jgi:hypothetical protein